MYIVINGGGKIGSYLAAMLLDNGHDVAIIELNEATSARLARDLPPAALVIGGDGCDSATLIDSGIESADIFVATTGRDDSNLVSCELAKTLYEVPRCIARVNNPRNERIFRRMGIESVSSTTVISRLIEEEALAGSFDAMKALHQNDLCMIQMRIPGGGDTLEESGIQIQNIDLPVGSLVAAVQRGDNLVVVAPETRLYPGDNVILISKTSIADDVREYLQNL